MKKSMYFIVILGIVGLLSSCNSHSKADTWSDEQQQQWKKECLELFNGKGLDKLVAEDHCDCMFKKTSEKYTPEEAKNISTEQEKKIWEDCDYSW